MRFTAAASTNTGHRSNNQDAYLVNPANGLFAVADGMGGYFGGEVASQVALEALDEFLADVQTDPDRTWPSGWAAALSVTENILAQGIHEAHGEVVRGRVGPRSQMGTTVVALYATAGLDGAKPELAIGHVGDSRAYRLRDGSFEALTRDHSLVEHWRELGMLSADDYEPSNMRHIVTAALGVGGFEHPTTHRETPRPGDRYMLCTDGLCGVVPNAEIGRILAETPAAEAVNSLVEAALAAGSKDNITVLIVDVEGREEREMPKTPGARA